MNTQIKSVYKIGIDARLWNETGVGRYIRNLVSELQKIDKVNEYVLFVLGKDIQEIQISIFNSQFSIIQVDILWHGLKEQIEFPKIIEKENLDLMHFPYFSVPIRYKGKYVLTIHDLILHHFSTGKASTRSTVVYYLKHIGYKFVISLAARNAEKIITVSNSTKKEIEDHLDISPDKIAVTYEGVDKKISNIKNQISNIKDPYFLYVGNAYPHKDLECLIQAFSNTKYKISNIKLILVGKDDYFYQRLEEKVKAMGLNDFVIFKHNISDEELSSYYSYAKALVIPSLMEGFGLPLLEAMSKKCLVVASDIPSFREVGEDIPLYFQPANVNDLASVLESIAKGRIADAKERKEKGLFQAKKFSWKKMAQQTLQVYQSCFGI